MNLKFPEQALGTADLSQHRDSSLLPVVVEAVDGPGKGSTATLSVGTVLVGAAPDCDLTVDDPAVSRRHLSIELLPGAVKVRDLQSRNGTTYLGAKISEAVVPVGGSLCIGRTVLRVSPQGHAPTLSEREQLGGLLGKSSAMRQLFATLERLGPADSTVLLHGESGTGKELVARALHDLSTRAGRPYVPVDCTSMKQELIESELFGHAKGAFTGADRARMGLLETAQNGTIFLDEIGELPLDLQAKLLRALESREFRRIGEGTVRRLEARVISATHRNLESEVAQGRFRQDLYHRLAVVVVTVPPLRDRREDIPLLAAHFAKQLTGTNVELAPSTLAALQCDPWPGNVRELRNAVERVIALAQAFPESAPTPSTPGTTNYAAARAELLEQFERDYLSSLLQRHRGNISAASRESGISRRQFHRLMLKHQLRGHD